MRHCTIRALYNINLCFQSISQTVSVKYSNASEVQGYHHSPVKKLLTIGES